MRGLAAAYDGLLNVLAVIAGAMIALMTVAVVADVIIRNVGYQPPPHTSAVVEYGMLYVTMFGAPWLLRRKGHVYIEVLLAYFGPGLRRACAFLTYLLCLAVCLVLAWYSIDLTYTSWVRGDTDIRSFDMPRWMLFACMPPSFALMSVEFVRYLTGRDSLYSGGPLGG